MKFNLVVAFSENFVIGKDGNLPWHYKEDLAHFKKLTTKGKKNVIIMGRKTFESLPPTFQRGNRTMCVISRSLHSTQSKDTVRSDMNEERGTHIFSTFKDLFCFLTAGMYDNQCVIGGSTIYKYFLENHSENLDVIYWTKIGRIVEGDTFFPKEYLIDYYIQKRTAPSTELEFLELKKRSTLSVDKQYQNLISHILKNGLDMQDRTKIGSRSIFGHQMCFDLQEGFPLLTTKKVFFRGIIAELLWFLSGSTDATVLQKKNVHIWDGNTSKENLETLGFSDRREGDGGPIYGFQMRHFGADYESCDSNYEKKGFDQVAEVLRLLKTEPSSRRIVMNLWDSSKIKEMVLAPCHVLYQFQVREGKLFCHLYQRSGDVGLGVPFNIASASLMTFIFAKLCGYSPGSLVYTLGDAHIYQNHIGALEMQQLRKGRMLPFLEIVNRGQKNVEDFVEDDFLLKTYNCEPAIKMEMTV